MVAGTILFDYFFIPLYFVENKHALYTFQEQKDNQLNK